MNEKTVDFETFWQKLRPSRTQEPDPAQSPKGWDVLRAIERAARKTNKELPELLGDLDIDPVLAGRLVTRAIQCFLEHWYEELRHGDAVHLIGVVLEGQNLNPTELKLFVRALPESLLERICSEPGPTASGMQAFLAIELAYRRKQVLEYRLTRDPTDDKLVVTFFATMGNRLDEPEISFKLDECFQGVDPSP